MLIEITTNSHEKYELRSLLVDDMIRLLSLKSKDLSSRELTVRVLHRQLITPPLELDALSALPDSELCQIAAEWAKSQFHVQINTFGDTPAFDVFKEAYLVCVANFERSIAEIITAVKSIVTPLAAKIDFTPLTTLSTTLAQSMNVFGSAVRSAMSDFVNALKPLVKSYFDFANTITQQVVLFTNDHPDFNFPSLIQNLPNFLELQVQIAKYENAADIIQNEGFSFVIELLDKWELVELGSNRIDPVARNAAITNSLLSRTRRVEFRLQMEKTFQSTRLLARRYAVVSAALDAHMNRNYALSIPIFLAQVEGVLADLMIIRASVIRKGNKLYVVDPASGQIMQLPDRKGRLRDVEVHGLAELVNTSKLKNDENLKLTASHLTERFAPQRNSILHGSDTNYAKARLSTEALLILSLLALTVEYEAELVHRKHSIRQ